MATNECLQPSSHGCLRTERIMNHRHVSLDAAYRITLPFMNNDRDFNLHPIGARYSPPRYPLAIERFNQTFSNLHVHCGSSS